MTFKLFFISFRVAGSSNLSFFYRQISLSVSATMRTRVQLGPESTNTVSLGGSLLLEPSAFHRDEMDPPDRFCLPFGAEVTRWDGSKEANGSVT